MRKIGRISSGCLPRLIIIIIIIIFAQLSLNRYIKKGKEGAMQRINSVMSGKLPEGLECVKEIKIKNKELSISLSDTDDLQYGNKISKTPIVFKNNCNTPIEIYSLCTLAGGESYYAESLSLENFDGRSAKFLVTLTHDRQSKPKTYKKEFIVNDSF